MITQDSVQISQFAQQHKHQADEDEATLHGGSIKSRQDSYGVLAVKQALSSRFALFLVCLVLACSVSLFFNWGVTAEAFAVSKDSNLSEPHSSLETVMEKESQIPKLFWLFESEQEDNSYMSQLLRENNFYFIEKSGYRLTIINEYNYHRYLSTSKSRTLGLQIRQLKAIASDPIIGSNLSHHIRDIIRVMTLLNILAEMGGAILNRELALTEDLTWLDNIASNIYVNGGAPGDDAKVIGFYSPAYTLPPTKQRFGLHLEEPERYVALFPTIESYFIAAVKESKFIKALIIQANQILKDTLQIKLQIQSGEIAVKGLGGIDIYYEYLMLAGQRVLQKKQKELDQLGGDRRLAIDVFGLALINCYYAPYKLKAFWKNDKPQKVYQNLAHYSLAELEANIGPLRYMTFFSAKDQLNQYLVASKEGRQPSLYMGSFFQKILFPKQIPKWIKTSPEKPSVNSTAKPWQSLPRYIWIYWDSGLKQSLISNQLCVENLRRMGQISGFELIQVNDSNVRQYLDKKIVDKINYTLSNAKVDTYPQTKSDLYRLALLARHGGIYLDASYIALQNFDWLINIGQYPSEFIFNRYGELPKVFMLFHPHYGSPFNWKIHPRLNVKTWWHLAYQNNLIIAQKDSELIKEWFDLFLELLLLTQSEISRIFQFSGIHQYKWTSSSNHYLLAMDAIKAVLGRRNNRLSQKGGDASEYYGLWSMSGYLGQQKLRSNTNFDNPGREENQLLWRYPQEYVEGLLGKIRHLTKFYNFQNKEISKFIKTNANNFGMEAHSRSIFTKYICSGNQKLPL